ncbi:hypothetical protein [Pseudoxanthomonas sp. CF125]|uniref:hypothetical protein n=1 Tax=Pseudoxanthomonas sp. CF125 TaxID=1855303 RepID=UPI000891424E|nr:hypothetical protein [Pseudoxanthomonas sp. CF125]SDQ42412.1 hypothetical protein SAMN05216569_1072 [Pseudoxanthomonas sp. CF125]
MSGKGSAPRPKSVEDDVFSANWSAAFGEYKESQWTTTDIKAESSSSPAPRSWLARLSSWLASFRRISG